MENSIAMNGGQGPDSYFKNSKFQEKGIDQIKVLLSTSIEEAIELENEHIFTIADLGCSVGPNTFKCVANIIEAVERKYTNHGRDLKLPEFQVFFNDHVSNDFNTLFKSLPSDKQYMTAGVPGSFRGRIFPKSSINFMHTSFTLHWISKVPEEVTKESSPLWNKGRITYTRSSLQVQQAFRNQFLKDLHAFFLARSEELKPGGLLAIIAVCRPEETPPSISSGEFYEIVGDALNDMEMEGLISEGLVDSFNLPIYIPTACEITQLLPSMKDFSIVKIDKIAPDVKLNKVEDIDLILAIMRSTLEDTLCKHFGSHIMEELFRRNRMKLEAFAKTPSFNHTFPKFEHLFLMIKLSHYLP